MLISLAVAVCGIWLAHRMYVARPEMAKTLAERVPGLYNLLVNKYYVDEFYDSLFVVPLKNVASILWKGVDVLLVDGLVNGLGQTFRQGSGVFRRLQTGYAKTYLLSMVIGIVAITLFYTWR